MADKELQTILNSGDINSIYIGGATSSDRIQTITELNAAYARLDGSNNQTKLRYSPQNPAPAYTEGNTFYSDLTGTLDVQGAFSDVTVVVTNHFVKEGFSVFFAVEFAYNRKAFILHKLNNISALIVKLFFYFSYE